ncbi:Bax inhibitor-1 family protein [Pyruvatibacter mobilis]|uniref:Bax inhibitor-1/YccA family protein n=1 Tax=Pyruvatibacter mobilis TaxID=1712261 RepID=UPI00040DBE96
MADYDSEVLRGRSPAQARGADIDAGLRSYMLRVYNYMAGGLAITGVIAYVAYTMAVVQTPQGLALSGFGQFLFASPFKWLVMLAPLAIVFFLSFRVHKMSVPAAQATFWGYAALMGLSMASIFLVFTGASIFQVFLITAASFGALSLWGYTTSKDISGWGSFLFMGLIGVILASVVNIFLGSGALQFAISVIGVLVFAGLTAYDTQQIKEMYDVNDDGTVAGRKAIMGALRLYLDFINLFIMLLQLFGSRE